MFISVVCVFLFDVVVCLDSWCVVLYGLLGVGKSFMLCVIVGFMMFECGCIVFNGCMLFDYVESISLSV